MSDITHENYMRAIVNGRDCAVPCTLSNVVDPFTGKACYVQRDPIFQRPMIEVTTFADTAVNPPLRRFVDGTPVEQVG